MMLGRRYTIASAFVAAVFAQSGSAQAAPQIIYHISGAYAGVGDTRLDDTSLINNYTTGGTNGGQPISPPGPFLIDRTEIFSDPDVTATPYAYSSITNFGYFGLLSTYDGNGDRTGASFYIATKTGTVTGQTFNSVFGDFLTAHPAITSLADFVTVIDNGPDFPTPGAGTAWIDFNDYVSGDSTGRFLGKTQTDFQTGDVLNLTVFNNATGIASSFGTIAISATPEPAMLALAAPAVALLRRRRR